MSLADSLADSPFNRLFTHNLAAVNSILLAEADFLPLLRKKEGENKSAEQQDNKELIKILPHHSPKTRAITQVGAQVGRYWRIKGSFRNARVRSCLLDDGHAHPSLPHRRRLARALQGKQAVTNTLANIFQPTDSHHPRDWFGYHHGNDLRVLHLPVQLRLLPR